jgi:hypothetical protein
VGRQQVPVTNQIYGVPELAFEHLDRVLRYPGATQHSDDLVLGAQRISMSGMRALRGVHSDSVTILLERLAPGVLRRG